MAYDRGGAVWPSEHFVARSLVTLVKARDFGMTQEKLGAQSFQKLHRYPEARLQGGSSFTATMPYFV
jgi:hypothetical protein